MQAKNFLQVISLIGDKSEKLLITKSATMIVQQTKLPFSEQRSSRERAFDDLDMLQLQRTAVTVSLLCPEIRDILVHCLAQDIFVLQHLHSPYLYMVTYIDENHVGNEQKK